MDGARALISRSAATVSLVDEALLQPATAAVRTTVILPAFNEEAGVAAVLERLLPALPSDCEVIVVDDGSTDATSLSASFYPVRLISHASNRGKAAAMRTGLRAARGENVIFIDADDTYPAEMVETVAGLLEEYDAVVCSRRGGQENIPAPNRLGNAVFRVLIRRLYGFRPHDPLTGFYGLRREHVQRMHLRSEGFRVEAEIAAKGGRMGLRVFDLSVEYRRRVGEAKLRGLPDGATILQTIASLAPVYSPTLSLALPGAIVMLLAGLLLLASSPASDAFPLLALACFCGSLLLSAGFVLSLYGQAHRHLQSDFLGRALARSPARRAVVVTGALAFLGGVFGLTAPVLAPGAGPPPFLAGFSLTLGLQWLITAGLLSALAGDLPEAP